VTGYFREFVDVTKKFQVLQ